MGKVEDRFWSKVDRRGSDECWEWKAGRFVQGYGAFRFEGQNRGAHRIAWIFAKGPIPGGKFVLHTCDNPPCVNPAHLWLGSPQDNMADKMAKGRHRVVVNPVSGDAHYLRNDPMAKAAAAARLATYPKRRGSRHGNAKLDESRVREIRRRYAEGDVRQRELAREYGVAQTLIGLIVRRKIWGHVS